MDLRYFHNSYDYYEDKNKDPRFILKLLWKRFSFIFLEYFDQLAF